MNKFIYTILLIIPLSALAINQKEANVIADIIKCKNINNDRDKIDCFEKNAEELEKVFPIATLDKENREIEIKRIEKEKKEDSFGVLQNVNPIASKENESLNSLSSNPILFLRS